MKHPVAPTRRQMLRQTAALSVGTAALPWLSPATAWAAPAGDSIGIGILGAAHIHVEQCARILGMTQGVQVRAIFDESPALAQRAQRMMGGDGVAVVDDAVEALLGRADVQAVVILAENIRHEPYAVAAAKAGKHLFVEKPLEIVGDKANRIAEAVEQAGVIFQTGYAMRSQGNIRFIRQAMREGKFGKVHRLRLQYAHAGSLIGWWDEHYAWMAQRDKVGRGALGDLGIHCLDLLLWFTQGDAIQALAAHVANATGKYDGIDEFGEAIFRFDSGLVATIASSYVDQSDANRLEISGTEGHAYISRDRLFVKCPNITGEEREMYWSRFDPSLPHPFEMYLAAIKGQADLPLIPVAEAAQGVVVMDKVYQAAQNGRWVKA